MGFHGNDPGEVPCPLWMMMMMMIMTTMITMTMTTMTIMMISTFSPIGVLLLDQLNRGGQREGRGPRRNSRSIGEKLDELVDEWKLDEAASCWPS
jgi:hypothetical protein